MGLLGNLGKKAASSMGTMAALGGLALVTSLFDDNETRVVHEYVDESEEDKEERREREEERREREEERREREEERRERDHKRALELQRIKAETENPNDMTFIKERMKQGYSVTLYCLIGVMITLSFAYLEWDTKKYLWWFLFICITVLLCFIIFKNLQKMNRYKKYISLIVVQSERNIMSIAERMDCSYEEARKIITKVISKGYIKGFRIDNKKRMVVEGNIKNKNNQINHIDTNSDIVKNANILKEKTKKRWVCKNCGGILFVEQDGDMYCKYCGGRV